MAGVCVRRLCGRLSGRGGADGEGPLLSPPGGGSTRAAGAARRGLKQLRGLCRQCDALAPLVEQALAADAVAAAAGQVQLASIRSRLEDLASTLLEAQCQAEASSSSRAGVREVVHCIAATGSDAAAWCSGSLVLSETGLEFETGQRDSRSGTVQLVPWANVARLETRTPSDGLPGCSTSQMYEADLELCRPPGRLRFQFGHAQPMRWLDSLWKATRTARGPAPAVAAVPLVPGVDTFGREVAEFWAPILRDYAGSGWRLAAQADCVERISPLGCPGATAASIHEELERSDGEGTLVRLWQSKDVSEFTHPAWVPLGGGLATCFGLRLPLKPVPMAPKSSRLSVLYHLTGGGDKPTELTWMSKSLDVPYASSFIVLGKFLFRDEAEAEGGAAMECHIGWLWLGRCMVKGVIESASRKEAVETCRELAGLLCEALAPGAGGRGQAGAPRERGCSSSGSQ